MAVDGGKPEVTHLLLFVLLASHFVFHEDSIGSHRLIIDLAVLKILVAPADLA